MADDYYTRLGVDPRAPAEEIKRKYREIARKYHPDKNPGDLEAEGVFKDAAEAYRVLSDPDRRAEYDREIAASSTLRSRSGLRGGRAASEVFEEIFGGARPANARARSPSASGSSAQSSATPPGSPTYAAAPGAASRGSSTHASASSSGRGPPPERGNDLRYTLELTFEEAALGAKKTIIVPQSDRCQACAGTGAQAGSVPVLCSDCGGSGTKISQNGFFETSTRCPRCSGVGRLLPHDCRACGGKGRVRLEREICVAVPPGVDRGTRLKLSGEGEAGRNNGPHGDLFVIVDLKPHPLFERDGADVLLDIPISSTTAALGGEVEAPTIFGLVWLRVPPGTQHGTVLRLKGQGLQTDTSQGDQRVRVLVEVPESLSPDQRLHLERLAELEMARPVSHRMKQFDEAVAQLFQKSAPER